MVEIIKHTKFHARAMKEPDFENGTLGYNFSYPVLNTIEIGNLFITGGSITIQMERIGKAIWSFDKTKSDLSIKKNEEDEEFYHIDNPKELYQAMSEHFQKNRNQLIEENLSTNEKKKIAKKDNQNAAKRETKAIQPFKPENNTCNKEDDIPPKDFIRYFDFHGTDVAYCVLAKQKGWLEYVSYDVLRTGWMTHVLKPEDIPEKIKKEHPSEFRGVYKPPEIKMAPRGSDW